LVTKLSDVKKKNPNLKVAVVGHTDHTGDFNYNLQLSLSAGPRPWSTPW